MKIRSIEKVVDNVLRKKNEKNWSQLRTEIQFIAETGLEFLKGIRRPLAIAGTIYALSLIPSCYKDPNPRLKGNWRIERKQDTTVVYQRYGPGKGRLVQWFDVNSDGIPDSIEQAWNPNHTPSEPDQRVYQTLLENDKQ